MRKYVLALAVVALTWMTTSCMATSESFAGDQDGKRVTEVRKGLKDFTKICIVGMPSVYYVQGNSYSVKVVGNKEDIAYVSTRVDKGELSVRQEGQKRSFGLLRKDDGVKVYVTSVKVYVTSPDLTGVTVLGSGDFTAKSKVDTDQLHLQLRGSGDIDFEKPVICDKVYGQLRGSGDIDISQIEALGAEWSLLGSGDVKVSQKNVGNTSIELRGSGDVKVNLMNCGAVDCQLTGSGDISLSGQARSLQKKVVGSGDLHTSNLSLGK